MTDKPYIEPLGGSYLVDKPGAKPIRKEWTEHDRHGAPPVEQPAEAPAVAEVAPSSSDKKGK